MEDIHSLNIPENIKVLVRVRPLNNDEIFEEKSAGTLPEHLGVLPSTILWVQLFPFTNSSHFLIIKFNVHLHTPALINHPETMLSYLQYWSSEYCR